MSSSPHPAVMASLRQLAAQSGVLWSGLLDRSNATLLAFLPDGSFRPSTPADSVLIDAIITASSALSDRIGLDTPTDFEHRSSNGGLLIHAPNTSKALVLCHGPAAPLPLLRLALRDCARLLPAPASTPSQPWQPAPPIWADSAPALTRPQALAASGQSEVYNPFTSA
jgi:hypothetical protein